MTLGRLLRGRLRWRAGQRSGRCGRGAAGVPWWRVRPSLPFVRPILSLGGLMRWMAMVTVCGCVEKAARDRRADAAHSSG